MYRNIWDFGSVRADIRKKALSSLVTGRKRLLSWCHPCSAQKAPSGLLLREGDRARLRARWWSRLPAACRRSFQPGDPSLVRRCERYLLRHCGFSSYDIIPKRGKSQSFSTLCGNKTGGPQGRPSESRGKRLGLGIDDVSPIKVAPRPTRWYPSCGDPSDFKCGRRK